ncbi:MAG TPA: hypothetical protein VHR45_00745 [Thermoanaerobaculia bacterium]|nr:hypothetical protein [Thermoanaerobaculia bacterium]
MTVLPAASSRARRGGERDEIGVTTGNRTLEPTDVGRRCHGRAPLHALLAGG